MTVDLKPEPVGYSTTKVGGGASSEGGQRGGISEAPDAKNRDSRQPFTASAHQQNRSRRGCEAERHRKPSSRRSRSAGSKRKDSAGAGGNRREAWRAGNHGAGKEPSNPKGWPDRYLPADLDARPQRVVVLNGEQEHWFCSNFVRTSKYTLLDFLPRFLMDEFHPRRKMANAYFLVLASLQTIPEITNTFGVPTILLPLSAVIIVDAFFAIIEDVARHRADAKANATPTRAMDLNGKSGRFRKVEWSDVRVGDLLLVKNRESIPADLLVVGTHEPNSEAKAGICYVETKSLDGETNLKIRQAIRPTIGLLNRAQDSASLRGRVEMEHPDKLIDSFRGAIEVEGAGANGESTREAIQPRNLLLRGCVLRNTPWVVGLVLNTGPDTKIIMSSMEPPHKSSFLEQRTNVEVWRIVRLLCFVCLLGAVGSFVWTQTIAPDHTYLMWDLGKTLNHVEEAMIQFFYLFLLLGNFIPVSLYVSMSSVKFCQAFFMKQDLDMYHEESDTPALVRTMALNEELGQVSHVFSDKTGTLTQNVMEFRKFSVGGVSYGRGVTDIGRAVAEGLGEQIPSEDLEAERVIAATPPVPHVRFYDPELQRHLDGGAGEEQRLLLSEFFIALAVCHTVIPERRKSSTRGRRQAKTAGNGNNNTNNRRSRTGSRHQSNRDLLGLASEGLGEEDPGVSLKSRCSSMDFMYEESETEGEGGETEEEIEGDEEGQPKLSASSPDDEALVLGARHFGMEFRDRVDNNACVRRSGPFQRDAQPYGQAYASPRPLSAPQGRGLWDSGGGVLSRASSERFVDERYQVLRILDFTSQRKRMSVIVRDPRGRVRVLCKGADSIMIPRLAALAGGEEFFAAETAAADAMGGDGGIGGVGSAGRTLPDSIFFGSTVAVAAVAGWGTADGTAAAAASKKGLASNVDAAQRREDTLEHMERYAREGLRTLLVTSADLEPEWFFAWDKRFEAASTDMAEIEKKKDGKPNAIDDLMDEVETNLTLLGCTAIEDKLQDGVGNCVDSLQGAGVKVWMLTGDKEETAINIAVACQLLGPETNVERVVINMDPQSGCSDSDDMRERLEEELDRLLDEQMEWTKGSGDVFNHRPPRSRALIIDGQALTLALGESCRGPLAAFAMRCAAVVCCRVSPDQKREVVALVREAKPNARTLAIGDGANDVAMIQGAHIGIGISGQEGMQAVNASDFAIAQFRFLKKLMLFHGRQNYRRMSKLVVYTFYKNILMAIPMAWYIVRNGYSGQKFYTEGGIQFYNVLFTLVPILFLGCFDRDVSLEDTDRFPGLYLLGINNVFFNPKVFWSWIAQAAGEAALITFVPLALLKGGPYDDGVESSLFVFGATTFTLVVLLANSKIIWLQYRWTKVAAVLVILSVSAWFGVASIINVLVTVEFEFFQVFFHLLANPQFWAVISLCLTAVFMRDLTWKFFHRWWQPKLHHIILEAEAKGAGPVNITPEEWAAASKRAGGGSDGASICREKIFGKSRHGRRRRRRTVGGINSSRHTRAGGGGAGAHVSGLGSNALSEGMTSGRADEHSFETVDSVGDAVGGRQVYASARGWTEDDVGFGSGSRKMVVGGSHEGVRHSNRYGGGGGGATSSGAGAGGSVPEKQGSLFFTSAFSESVDIEHGGRRTARSRQTSGNEGHLPSLESAWGMQAELAAARGGRAEGAGAGGARSMRGGSSEHDGAAEGCSRNTEAMSSRPSSFGTAGDDEERGLTESTPMTMSRSWSWTLPPDPLPPTPRTGRGVELTRPRSERYTQRRLRGSRAGAPAERGTAATRTPSHCPRVRSGGFAYSTDEASASLESNMILNYVESPLRKTPAFWEARRSALDRLIRRRDSGLLPVGYGTGRWSIYSTAPVGPRSKREIGTTMSRSVSMDGVGNHQVIGNGGSGTDSARESGAIEVASAGETPARPATAIPVFLRREQTDPTPAPSLIGLTNSGAGHGGGGGMGAVEGHVSLAAKPALAHADSGSSDDDATVDFPSGLSHGTRHIDRVSGIGDSEAGKGGDSGGEGGDGSANKVTHWNPSSALPRGQLEGHSQRRRDSHQSRKHRSRRRKGDSSSSGGGAHGRKRASTAKNSASDDGAAPFGGMMSVGNGAQQDRLGVDGGYGRGTRSDAKKRQSTRDDNNENSFAAGDEESNGADSWRWLPQSKASWKRDTE